MIFRSVAPALVLAWSACAPGLIAAGDEGAADASSDPCPSCAGDCATCPAACGNAECDSDESCSSCPGDCGACPAACGNGTCEAGETCSSCAADCGACPTSCGNGTCGAGETCSSCAADCGACPAACGNGTCGAGETCSSCAADCGACPAACGNGTCEAGETCSSCAADCGACPPVCGNGQCETGETSSSCAADCGGTCTAASSYRAPASVGTVTHAAINEASGLAASRRSPGYFYVNNDSGDSPRVFVLDSKGVFLGIFTVSGATAVDWEDAATGPCPAGHCLFVGDIGDNGGARTNCAVYRMPEPDIAGGAHSGTLTATKFPFSYPDGPRDAESLMVHPLSGDIYIISKTAAGNSRVYKFPKPLQPGVKVTLLAVGPLTFPTTVNAAATAAAIHPCGDRFLVRTYGAIYEYRASSAQSFETAFTATRTSRPAPGEPQGETVEYRWDGLGYFTLSEGLNRTLYFMQGQ